MRETKIILIDDIDGSEAQETIYFSVGRDNYEIDLSGENAAKFNEALQHWVSNARKTRAASGKVRSAAPAGKSDAAQIRAWARENGIDVPSKGRIPFQIREQYQAATRG